MQTFLHYRWRVPSTLHRLHLRRIIPLLLLALCVTGAKAQTNVKFNGDVRYSQWVIDSRMNDFYANTTPCGFAVYDQSGTQTSARVDGKTKLDYVVGLVAKSIIEASQYYSQYTWAQSFAKPWFLSIQNYGDYFYNRFKSTSGSLDDLNAVKLFIPLRALTETKGKYPDETTHANTTTALNTALSGLGTHNKDYSIGSGTLAGNTVAGGWWHKSDYQDQMWLDGSYMGPALFAQLVNYSNKITNIDATNDWNLIVKQFTILRNMCWNSEHKLLYHAFAADGGTNTTSHSDTWYGLSHTDTYCFHSASYWGRAVGWYFLALVDVLEQMDNAKLTSTEGYTTLLRYLTETAEGIKARQDQTTGGWYQILDENSEFSASSYNGKSYTPKYNYIESSATALFTAAYLKAIRLKYLTETDYKTVAENGYKCLVNNFFSVDADHKVNIFGSCRSAGLGGSGNLYEKGADRFRDGSKEYYLLGYDVARVDKTENLTEGKVMGAFIMAATEYERANPKDIRFSYDLAPSYTLAQGKSIKAEALGSGTITYKWCKSDGSEVSGATSETFTPAESGTYYCKATSGNTTIQTSTTEVTVNAVSNDVITTGEAIATFEKLTSSTPESWTAKENKGFTVTGIPQTKDYAKLGVYAVKMNHKGSSNGATTIKLNVPEGYTVTSLIITAINASTSNNTQITLNGVDKVPIDKVANAYKEYKVRLTNPVTGSNTISITNSGEKELGISQIKVLGYQGTPSSLSITQPVSADYLQGATATALSVTASIVNGTTSDYTFKYQWYSNDEESTTNATAIGEPTTEPSCCTPDVTVIGTKYYYCVVTATKGTEVLTATSDFAKVTVNGPTVTFTTQPQGAVYTSSESNVAALTVAATTNFSGTVAYQWYSNTTGKIPETDAEKEKEKISNATLADYTPSISEVGTTYYYCIASSTYDSKDYTATSDIVSVEVVGKLYSRKVTSSDTAPQCNDSWYITGDTENDKLVKFTFGGWKYNNNRYLKPNADNIDANYITDEWSAPATQEVNALDGYQYAISGKNDAVQENKAEETTMYKKTRYGWFQSPTRNTDGVTTDSHPYTLPVRGAYMTFEPTQNGTLTIYLLQNGAWNSDTKNKIDIIPGEFRMHAFQITNQRGLVLAEFAPQYKITVNQKVKDGYTCSQYENDPGTGNYDKTSKDISNWEEFWALTYDERKAVHDNWSNGTNGSQTIIKLQDGSFLAIQKAIVKYQFHVTGNETYYLFSNFSKLGFSGATFQPDTAQPTDDTTFSGANRLSDTKPYTKITPTADGTIGDTGLTKYKYKIGDQEIKLVDGVFIPQFKAITLDRKFKKDQWTTLTLPFNLTQTEVEQIFGKGTEILVFKDAITEGTKLHIKFIYHEIQNILPGYPYLIKPTLVMDDKGTAMTTKETSTDNAPIYTIVNTEIEKPILTSFTVYGKAINPHITQHEFTAISKENYVAKGTPDYCTASENGVYSKKYEEGDLFISEGDGKLYISQGASYGKGYRSYIDGPASSATKTLSLSFSGVEDGEGDGTTTEISVAELADDVIEAFGIKGVYNLNGQKVAETTRNLPAGIYVVNGRKVVVK